MKRNMLRRTLTATLLVACSTSAAFAVQPGRWMHTTEADYTPGKKENTVATNLGDVKLSTSADEIGKIAEQASIIYDMQFVGGDLYLAGGPEGKILLRQGDKITEAVSLPNEQVFALDQTPDGKLLVGVSGAKSRLAVLEGGKLKTLVTLAGVRYIWDLLADKQTNTAYAATGACGRLFAINLSKVVATEDKPASRPATKPAMVGEGAATQPQAVGVTELYKAAQSNLLCLG